MEHIGLVVAVVAVVLVAVVLAVSYVKAPPDMAYIISGLKRRTVIGGANFRIPFLERLDKVTLELIQIDKTVQLSDGLSKGLGIDLKSLLVGAFGAKILEKGGKEG